MKLIIKSNSPDETFRIGARIGSELNSGDVIGLIGELGAGKTYLIKGIAKGAGCQNANIVTSPTFTFIHIYAGKVPIYHVDFYRVKDYKELKDIGAEDVIYGDGIALVEWADRAIEALPADRLMIRLKHAGDDVREIKFEAEGRSSLRLLKTISKRIQELKRERRV